MSPRAAWRLEAYGYDPVYDYVAGKSDWLAFNLPLDGSVDLVGDHLSSDILNVSPSDRLADILSHIEEYPVGLVVAFDQQGIVMGTLDPLQLDKADPAARVEDVMWEGPTTVRPSEDTHALTERMRNADVGVVMITSSDGKLLGLYRRHHGRTEPGENPAGGR